MVIGDSKCLLDPRGFVSVQWDLLIALLLITTIFTMPLSMAFQYFQTTLFPLDFMADILFVLDVFKHFNTGYIDEFDFSIMDSGRVRRHYMSTWFMPDLLSSIPVEVINVAFTSGVPGILKASRILKLLRLSRLAKVFRLMKVTKLGKLVITCKESFEDYFRVQVPEGFLILGRLWLSLLVLAHWVGCINFMVARQYGFPEESWVVFADLQNAPINVQYSWCFFKALAQLIGVGFDIPPIVNTSCLERTEWCTAEHWITLTCLYVGSVYVALLISSISYVIVNMNKGSSNLSMQLWTLNEYLASKKVPYSIRDRVRNFYRIRFAEGKMYEEEEILRVLPPNLRDDILSHNQKHVYEQVPLLASPNTPQALRSRLAPMLEKRIMFQHEVIFDEGAIGSEMFFIVSGIVEIVSQHRSNIIKAISDGCYFGDVAVLLGGRRTASCRARTNLVLSAISRSEMLEIVSEFPMIKK
jgi:hyperpolarization activated cyclic nucleotide-gated potassium channel 2